MREGNGGINGEGGSVKGWMDEGDTWAGGRKTRRVRHTEREKQTRKIFFEKFFFFSESYGAIEG